MKNVLILYGESNKTEETTNIVIKESLHLPTLVAGVMHNIEPAHHALQQGIGVNGGGGKNKIKKSVTESDKTEI